MQRTPQVDYPAAHSMDTYWFAIDDAGEVAHMETHENGPVPTGERIDGIYDLFACLDKDEFGIRVFPVDQEFFPEGLNARELENILANLPEPERKAIQQLAFNPDLGANEKQSLKKSVNIGFLNFVALLADQSDIKEFELVERDDEIIRLDPLKPIFHVKGSGYIGVDALCLLVKGRLLAWRQVQVDIGDPDSIADFYGIYIFGSDMSSFEGYSYLDGFQFPLAVPIKYEKEKVPKKPRIGLFAKAMAEKWKGEKPGARLDGPPIAFHMPGVRFSEMQSIQVADFIPCYSWGDGNLLPDSGDSVMRRNLTVIHTADAAERDRHVAQWHQAAEQGDVLAQYTLAYWYSQGPSEDAKSVLYWQQKIAQQAEATPSDSTDIFKNGSVAQLSMAHRYEHGGGVPQDDAQALDWYIKSANKGNYLAQYRLGMRYKTGHGVVEDKAQARFWLTQSANEGYDDAHDVLWSFPNFEGAEQGDKDAQYELAQMYGREDRGVEKDDDRARHWYTQSAIQGNACAQYELGKIYMRDSTVSPDLALARHWLAQAAAQGNDDAKRLLKETEVCIAAERGDMKAMFALAYLYQQWKNYPHAVYWYRKVAEQAELAPSHSLDMFENGSAAQCNLADKYEHGLGVAQDDERALDWYRKSAALNNYVAQYSLGMMYMRGRGVPKDMAQARAWLIQSAEQGYDKARSALQEIATLPEG